MMKFTKQLNVFVYPVDIVPEPAETYLYDKVIKKLHRQIELILTPYAIAGKALISPVEIEDELTYTINCKDTVYEVTVRASRRT